MSPERRRLAILLGLLGILLVVAVYRFWPSAEVSGTSRAAARPGGRANGPSGMTAPDVHLQALKEDRPEPAGDPERNLFRFKPKPAPPSPAPSGPPPGTTGSGANPGPPPPSGPAPIAMRFIGLVEAPERAQKIAILSDSRGIYHGREGDIIEGRYRILRIGVESLDMAYLDGRGRQTIRLSGS